jgi:pimeloyl-ACP methyl ester carboxylesterase
VAHVEERREAGQNALAMTLQAKRLRIPLPEAGLEIALLDWGGVGPPALLHHANGFCAALWQPVAQRLRPHFRVFAMDARGHGDSTAPAGVVPYQWANFGRDLAAVGAALTAGFGPIELGVGHSFGGTAMVLAALERPSLFRRIALLDPVVVPSDPQVRELMGRGNLLADAARKRRHVWDNRAQARDRWAGKETFAGWDRAIFELYLAEALGDLPDGRVALKCSPEVEATIFELGAGVDVMDRASELRTPALILWASRGNFPRSHFEELASRMPEAALRDAATGHFVPMEDPGLVVAELLAFQRSTG